MTKVFSSLDKDEDGTGLLLRSKLQQLAGAGKHLTRAEFDAAVISERSRITNNGEGLYEPEEPCTVAGEAGVRRWNAAGRHWRTVELGSLRFTLPSDESACHLVTGWPAAGLGLDDDRAYSFATQVLYGKAAGGWIELQSLAPGGGGSLPVFIADFVVYGANAGGITAAAKARSLGLTVEVINEFPQNRIMGMAMGIMHTDIDYTAKRGKGIVRGTADQLYARVAEQYGITTQRFMNDSQYGCRPDYMKVAYEELLAQHDITVRNDEQLVSVQKTGANITSITTTKGIYQARTFMDATYHGDLMDRAGLTTLIGRNSRAQYGEAAAGVGAPMGEFSNQVSPYVTPGNPASGLLWGIDNFPPETVGDASPLVQVCCIRLFHAPSLPQVTKSPAPPNYDPKTYELLRRNIIAKNVTTLSKVLDQYNLQANGQVDWNNAPGMGMSLNYHGPIITEYVTASHARRVEIELEVKNYTLGLLHFLRTEPSINSQIRTAADNLKIMNPEVFGGDGFPVNYYLRQGRCAVGDPDATYMPQGVMVQSDAQTAKGHLNARLITRIGYPGDRHQSRRFLVDDPAAVDGKRVETEGGMALAHVTNAIPMQAIWPKAAEANNLVLNFGGCFTAIYQGFVRMEPQMMMMGDAAGAMAAAMKATGKTLQALDYADIEERQDFWDCWRVSRGGALVVPPGNGSLVPAGIATGTTTQSGTITAASGATGVDFKFGGAVLANSAQMTFAPNLAEAGVYEVTVGYTSVKGTNRNTATEFVVNHAGGSVTFTRNQNCDTGLNDTGDWDVLGQWSFPAGTPSSGTVQVRCPATGSTSIIGAVAFRRVS